eukprot:4134680-Alexandrium_andersonii.AAC.1
MHLESEATLGRAQGGGWCGRHSGVPCTWPNARDLCWRSARSWGLAASPAWVAWPALTASMWSVGIMGTLEQAGCSGGWCAVVAPSGRYAGARVLHPSPRVVCG